MYIYYVYIYLCIFIYTNFECHFLNITKYIRNHKRDIIHIYIYMYIYIYIDRER